MAAGLSVSEPSLGRGPRGVLGGIARCGFLPRCCAFGFISPPLQLACPAVGKGVIARERWRFHQGFCRAGIVAIGGGGIADILIDCVRTLV